MPGLSDFVSLRPNGNAGKVTLSSFESHHDPAAVINPAAVTSLVDVTAAPGAMTFSDDIHHDPSSLKNGIGSDVTVDPSRNAKMETEQRILSDTVIAHDLILTVVNSVAPRDFMPDGFDRFVLDTSNAISAFLNEANIGLSPDTEKRSLMNEAFILTTRTSVTSVVATDVQDSRNETSNPNLETVNPYQAEKQGPAFTVKFSSPGKETVSFTKHSAQAMFAARDSDDFDIIANVTSFLGRDVDAVHLCKLLHSGLDGSLSAVVNPFSNDACKVISEDIQACDAFVNPTVTDADVIDHRRKNGGLARCPVVSNETRVKADKANQVQYSFLLGDHHNGYSLEMVQSLLLGATIVICYFCNRKRYNLAAAALEKTEEERVIAEALALEKEEKHIAVVLETEENTEEDALPENYNSYKVVELKKLCIDREIDVKGLKKADLVARLEENDSHLDLGDSVTNDDSFDSDASSVEVNNLDFSEMKVAELKNECAKRGISFTGMRKADLIDVLTQNRVDISVEDESVGAPDFASMKVIDLKLECKSRNISSTGNKAVLIKRLQAFASSD